MTITGVKGLSAAEIETLKALGAVKDEECRIGGLNYDNVGEYY